MDRRKRIKDGAKDGRTGPEKQVPDLTDVTGDVWCVEDGEGPSLDDRVARNRGIEVPDLSGMVEGEDYKWVKEPITLDDGVPDE